MPSCPLASTTSKCWPCSVAATSSGPTVSAAVPWGVLCQGFRCLCRSAHACFGLCHVPSLPRSPVALFCRAEQVFPDVVSLQLQHRHHRARGMVGLSGANAAIPCATTPRHDIVCDVTSSSMRRSAHTMTSAVSTVTAHPFCVRAHVFVCFVPLVCDAQHWVQGQVVLRGGPASCRCASLPPLPRPPSGAYYSVQHAAAPFVRPRDVRMVTAFWLVGALLLCVCGMGGGGRRRSTSCSGSVGRRPSTLTCLVSSAPCLS